MPKFRNVRVRMKSGKTRIQRAMVLASGKLKFVKNLSRSRGSSASRQTKTKHRRSVRSMGKKKRRGGGKSLARSLEKIVKTGALVAPAVYKISQSPNAHGLAGALYSYSGYNVETGEFHLGQLVEGWGPYVAVEIGSKIAHKVIGLVRRI